MKKSALLLTLAIVLGLTLPFIGATPSIAQDLKDAVRQERESLQTQLRTLDADIRQLSADWNAADTEFRRIRSEADNVARTAKVSNSANLGAIADGLMAKAETKKGERDSIYKDRQEKMKERRGVDRQLAALNNIRVRP